MLRVTVYDQAAVSRFLVYGLVDPRDGHLRYIGKSTSGLLRPRRHGSPSSVRRNRHSACWVRQLKSLGLDYEITVIEECLEANELSASEQFWIAYFKSLGCNLTNATAGGDGAVGYRHTAEAKSKMSALAKKRTYGPVSEVARKNMIAAQQNRSAETRARISAAKKGHAVRPETRAKIAAKNTGWTPTPQMRVKMSTALKRRWANSHARAVMATKRDGKPFKDESGRIYYSQGDAARALGVFRESISACLRGKLKTTGGHSFAYCEVP